LLASGSRCSLADRLGSAGISLIPADPPGILEPMKPTLIILCCVLFSTLLHAADRVVSAFSSISPKHVLSFANSESDKNEEIDYFTQLCQGYAGYE
jgi:hypothetical protein